VRSFEVDDDVAGSAGGRSWQSWASWAWNCGACEESADGGSVDTMAAALASSASAFSTDSRPDAELLPSRHACHTTPTHARVSSVCG
jgi:hypothetical protein